MSENLELCPVCKKGYLRPTTLVATDDISDVRKLQCDNSDCETNGTNVGIREPGVKVSEDLGITVPELKT